MNRPALRVIHTETGEVVDNDCPTCQEAADTIAGLERVIRSQGASIRKLERNLAAEAHNHPLWEQAQSLFDYWRTQCGHPKAHWTVDRFWLVQPLLHDYGEDTCRKAIDGAAFDPYRTTRRNGSTKRHDDFELVFKSSGKVEEFCNRAPRKAA